MRPFLACLLRLPGHLGRLVSAVLPAPPPARRSAGVPLPSGLPRPVRFDRRAWGEIRARYPRKMLAVPA